MTTPDVAAVLIERQILLDRLEAEVEESLDQEIEEIKTLARGQNPDTGRPFGNDVAALFDTFLGDNVLAEGEALFTFVGGRSYRSTNKPPARLDQDPELVAQLASVNRLVEEQIDTPAGSVRYHAIPRPLEGQRRGVFVVANFLAQERAEVDLAVRVSGLAALAALLAAVGLAWVLAGRLLAPLRLLTDTARTITETDLTGRIPVRGRDEIAELTRTFNAMLDRLEDAFATQRAFLDDAGHELRTPITIIRGHLEVSGDDPEEREAATAVVMDELDRMARGVDDLLVLARAERPGFLETEPIDLAAFTSELHAKASALAPRTWSSTAWPGPRSSATGSGSPRRS